MSGEIEAAGAAVTAGAAAGAIEGAEARRVGDGVACANCATVISGKFCVACGQPTHVHRSLFHFLEDAMHSIFHFDTRAWRTLPMVAFRPGTFTRNYVMGQRARYISPVALFLFTVFLMFFAFAFLGDARLGASAPQTAQQLRAEVASEQAELDDARAELAKEQAELARMEASPDTLEPGELDGQRGAVVGAEGNVTGAEASLSSAQAALKRREDRIAQFKVARARLDVEEGKAKAEKNEEEVNSIATSKSIIDRALANPNGPPEGVSAAVDEGGKVNVNVTLDEQDGINAIFDEIKPANERGAVQVNTGNKKWDETIKHKLENPELARYKIQNTAYKFSFLLVPISLPFIWLLFFWKRGVTLFDHAVFGLYSLSFISILFIAMVIAGRLPNTIAAAALPVLSGLMALGVLVHMFFQLKGAYQLGWFSAFWRTIVLLLFSLVSLILFVAVIFMLGLLG
jgi:cell division protein FtsB